MARGLDELIEALVGEVSYYGDGCPITKILSAIKEYQSGGGETLSDATQSDSAQGDAAPGDATGGDATEGDPDPAGAEAQKSPAEVVSLSEAELSFARKVWEWFLSRTEAKVGAKGEWNHLSLDDLLAIPEDMPEDQAAGSAGIPAQRPIDPQGSKKGIPATRPGVFVSDETIWKSLTGHEPNFKRVPPLEWKCLVGIAATKEKGILQRELGRLTGQDKRSVPKRTDFLTQKGYIAKRTTIIRKSKTSKLWLSRFAPPLLQNADDPLSSQLQGVELSREVLVDNLDPVPWCTRWTGEVIDFLAFGQTLLAIVKTWGVIRITDLKTKLGILGSTWQMRTLAKQCRRFEGLGVFAYVAAVFQNDRQVFKDCIKFIRDPTDEEWREFLATGKKTSRYSDQTKNKLPLPNAPSTAQPEDPTTHIPDKEGLEIDRKHPRPKIPLSFTRWEPEKPLANTVFETLQLAGSAGLSNSELSSATVGFAFRRYMHKYLEVLTIPGTQPPNVRQFQLSSSLVRTGKNTAFIYSVASDTASGQQPGDVASGVADAIKDAQPSSKADPYGFSKLSDQLFGDGGSTTLSEIARPPAKVKERSRVPKRGSRPAVNNSAFLPAARPEIKTPRARANEVDSTPVESPAAAASPATDHRSPPDGSSEPVTQASASPVSQPPLQPPGVYIGEPGSLNPEPRRRGRRKKSLVVVFRSDKIKDPNFFQEHIAGSAAEIAISTGTKEEPATPRVSRMKRPREEAADEGDSIVVGGPPSVSGDEPIVSAGPSVAQDGGSMDEFAGLSKRSIAAIRQKAAGPTISRDIKVSHNGSPGELRLIPRQRSLRFTADPDTEQNEELNIRLDDIVDGPTVRAVPGSKGKGLIFTAKVADEGDSTWQYIFLLENGLVLSGNADAFVDDLVRCKTQNAHNDAAMLAEHDGTETIQPEHTPPRVKGRKVKATGKPSGRRFVCEKCGNSWKNDIGLKYHLTKSQTPCNPDYVPGPPTVEPRPPAKRRKIATLPGTPVTRRSTRAADTEQSSPGRQLRHLSTPLGPKEFARRQTRPLIMGSHAPRGLQEYQPGRLASPLMLPETQPLVQALSHPITVPTPASLEPVSRVSKRRESSISQGVMLGNDTGPLSDEETGSKAPSTEGTTIPVVALAELDEVVHGEHTLWPEKSTDSVVQEPTPMEIQSGDNVPSENDGQYKDGPLLPSQGALAITPVPVQEHASVPESKNEPHPNRPGAQTKKARVPLPHSPRSRTDTFAVKGTIKSSTDNSAAGATLPEEQVSNGPAPRPAPESDYSAREANNDTTFIDTEFVPRFSMPPRKPGSKISDSSFRTLQLMEIIRFMLDNTGGAFPGGKALWYAALKIWDSNVKGSEPPSLSTSSAAVKRLQSRNEAKEVVYGFKDSSGRYVTCSLVLRDHMDPNGPAATRMKRRIQEVHPNLYIPPPFSLSREEHLKFEDMDDTLRSGDTPKKQGRRDEKLLETVEVLNAPFYAKSGIKSVRARKRAIEEDDERPEDKRRKRDATQQLLEGRPAKRSRKAESKKPKDFVSYTDDEGYEDEDEDGEAWSSDHRRRARRPTADGEDILEQLGSFQSRETTIVPPPKRYRILAKSGAYSGNPGINSLPSSFFSRTDAIDNKQPTSSAEVRFLQPNTRLEESEGEEDRDDFGSIAFSAAPDRTNLSGAKSDANDVVPERFSGTIVLSDSQGSRGSWPALDDKFFQENDGSFAMRGWMPNPQDLSRELLPRSSQEMAGRLSNRFKPESWADPAWGYYCQTVEQCKKWELSDDGTQVMGSVRVAPDYIFINFSSTQSVSSMAQISDLQWLEENNWTLQTIPYNSLEDDTAEDFDELFGIIRRGPRRGRGRPRGRGGRRSLAGPASRGESGPQQRKKDVVPMEKARELTAYPRTSDDYIRPSESISGDLDWGATNTRIAAFVCTSTLLGGLNRAQDWGLLMRLFPDMKISRLRRYWKEIRKEREGFIQDLTETFQDAFLEAYESGELPPIDYDDLLAYDWPGLIKWTLQLTTQKSVQLPASREELEESFNVEDAEVDTRDWREDYYHWQRSIFKRFQDATSEAAAMAVQPVGPKRNVDDLAVLARSWVRAVCVTAENKYPSSLIREKLSKLGGLDAKQINGLLHDAINELESRKILRRRPRTSAGPPYSLNERFETSLSRYSQEDKLTQAIAFKSKLDEAFRRNEKVEVPYILDDGMIMAIMNLQAAGRVRTEPLSEPNIPFGFRPGFYETRQLPKKHYHWSLRVAPTETYLYNEDIDILKKAAGAAIPGERPDGKLPVWCDIFGDVEKGRWARLLGAVSFMLATRGAMTVERTFAALKTVTEVFEVEVIMQWAKELGILVEVIDGGALTVAEWWWLVCGSQLGGHAGDAGPPKTAVAEEDS